MLCVSLTLFFFLLYRLQWCLARRLPREAGLLPGGGAGQPGARLGAGARRGRSAGGRGARDADSNQLSEPRSPMFRSPEFLSGVRNGSCEILSKKKKKKQRQTLSPKGTFRSHFLSGGGLQSSQNEKAEMKTLQLFFLFLPGRASRTPPLPAPLARSSSPPPPASRTRGRWRPTPRHSARLGKGWWASRANYISHHAQHCGPL